MHQSDSSTTIKKLIEHTRHHRLSKGDRLPSERDLAEKLGVTRSTVREAYAMLEALRITERRRNSGIYLRADLAEGSLDALVLRAELGLPLSKAEVRDVVDARKMIETQAIRCACQRRTDADLAILKDILSKCDKLVADEENIAQEDALFHLAIVKATHNNVLMSVILPFYLISARRRDLFFANPDQCRRSHADHVKIVKAVERRDEQAATQLIAKHMKGIESYWLETLTAGSEEDARH